MKITEGPMKTTEGPMKITEGPMKTTEGPMKITEGPMKTTDFESTLLTVTQSLERQAGSGRRLLGRQPLAEE